jgi:DNA integrity scanning protein DisA with diadenylate cyclase activity
MTKQEIIERLENCIYLITQSDNVYVRKELELICKALIDLWNQDAIYEEQIKQVLGYDETMENLNNIKL